MKSESTLDFWKAFSRLPEDVKASAKRAFERFQQDPWHSSLHFKKVHGNPNTYSVRITRGYRAVGVMAEGAIVWFWIGSHTACEREIKTTMFAL